jgi:predicted nucleotidyltransferase component of viral defense system
VSEIDNFAIHGGTAINLFVLDLPRYSVDIDVTYIPIKSREETFSDIRNHLTTLKEKIKRIFPRIVIEEKPNKINCLLNGILVKIEVNGTKRGLIEPSLLLPLCDLAQTEFKTFCEAKIVSVSQLYGGKISAALDRQHPRDLFDIKLMFNKITDFSDISKGFFYSILGGDRPLVESLAPNRTDQRETLAKQFAGMTDIPFSYSDFE